MHRTYTLKGSILASFMFASLIFSSCTAPFTTTPEPPPVGITPPSYGLVYAYPPYEWEISDKPAIRKNFEYIKSLGIETIVQVFPKDLSATKKEASWTILLDEAKEADMGIIATLWPPVELEENSIDFQAISSFLSLVRDHQALVAFLGLHEPLERYTSEELKEFYMNIKEIAPGLPIAHFMGDIAGFDHNVRFPDRDFSPGICDICLVWYYPAKSRDDQIVFEKEQFRSFLEENRKLVKERAPDSQIWLLGQAFSYLDQEHDLRMPTPEEMREIYVIAYQEQYDGFMWYPWLHDSYDQILSDVEMKAQQDVIGQIYQEFILPGPLTSIDS